MKAESRTSRLSPAAERDISARLGILLGQIQAVQRMVSDERPCQEVLHQVVSARSAADAIGRRLWAEYLLQVVAVGKESTISELARTFDRMGLHRL